MHDVTKGLNQQTDVLRPRGNITMSRKRHNERCRGCKQSVRKMLAALFGRVETNWELNLPCHLDDYTHTQLADTFGLVYEALCRHRGFDDFVRSKKLPRVDYFLPDQQLIVEFDESQHFTRPRGIALGLYPSEREFGFSVSRWRSLCLELDKRDNDPPYRDEQRAWYDTLRDFAPTLFGVARRTHRLYSRDLIWCSLTPDRKSDLLSFEQIIAKGVCNQ